MPSPRKRNPQDATLRNIRALKARVKKLEAVVSSLDRNMTRALAGLYQLERRKASRL